MAIAARNAERNGVKISASQGSLPIDAGPFDLVFANLVASILVELAESLAEAVRPGDGNREIAGPIDRLEARGGDLVQDDVEVRSGRGDQGATVVDAPEPGADVRQPFEPLPPGGCDGGEERNEPEVRRGAQGGQLVQDRRRHPAAGRSVADDRKAPGSGEVH